MSPTAPAGPRFEIPDRRPLVDEPVRARLVGLRAGELVRLAASCRDAQHRIFSAWAELEADGAGSVALGAAAAHRGSYAGADAFGLWWSMRWQPHTAFATGLEPVPTSLVAEIGGVKVAETTLERLQVGVGVRQVRLQEGGLVGELFAPADPPAPPVLVLGGSGGGLHRIREMAALLASRGLAALALAYFGLPGLPEELAGIPMEYFEEAIVWLLQRPEVEGRRVGVVGASRGSEPALLLAATRPEIGAVVALSPSAVLWSGFAPSLAFSPPAWTRAGRALACLGIDPRLRRSIIARGGTVVDTYLAALEDREAVDRAAIPMERCRCPVLLVSGGDDAIWPSARFAEMLMARLERGDRLPHQHLHHPGAGHVGGRPPGLPASDGAEIHPQLGSLVATGGTQAANAASSMAAWPRLLEFLREHLGSR